MDDDSNERWYKGGGACAKLGATAPVETVGKQWACMRCIVRTSVLVKSSVHALGFYFKTSAGTWVVIITGICARALVQSSGHAVGSLTGARFIVRTSAGKGQWASDTGWYTTARGAFSLLQGLRFITRFVACIFFFACFSCNGTLVTACFL